MTVRTLALVGLSGFALTGPVDSRPPQGATADPIADPAATVGARGQGRRELGPASSVVAEITTGSHERIERDQNKPHG